MKHFEVGYMIFCRYGGLTNPYLSRAGNKYYWNGPVPMRRILPGNK